MPFDTQTRNRLARFVTDARELLAAEFTQQLQSIYGISPSGEVTALAELRDLDEEQQALAELLRDRWEYLKGLCSVETNPAGAAVDRLTREQAFTVLNRMAAIRMAEKRGFIVESVGGGYQSKGFQVYGQVAGSGLRDTYHRYRRYLFCLFDELAIGLGPLFDRLSPAGLLFPGEGALLPLLQLLNEGELDPLWAEDETIGWIYQYYNDEAERRRMREAGAPRNTRELAIRNQFFTPRYVVEFLTDNTLGRIWYEMTRGQTSLQQKCLYMVRRTNELFLDPGQDPPGIVNQGMSHAELLTAAVPIRHRDAKDPRELRVLDPACGSMHFGLYAYDLLETIYNEAWDLVEKGVSLRNGSLRPLNEIYSSREEFRREIPKMIVENNIHGIDIDARAVQIADLSLRLRAQKSWHEQNVSAEERPRIARSQIVCAEPMPENSGLFERFISTLRPPLLAELVCNVFERMQLAGEAGSLLRIEKEISALVQQAKERLSRAPKAEQILLFENRVANTTNGGSHGGIPTDQQFWETVESRIYEALQQYAEQGEDEYSRRLFRDDAARGFSFIDLCRKRYDAVVMNPPFGDRPLRCDQLLIETYPATSGDMYSMFFERALDLLENGGKVGVISNRTWLGLPSFEGLRTGVLGISGTIECAADLGSFVLEAQVETAAAIIGKNTAPSFPAIWVRLLKTKEKDSVLCEALREVSRGVRHRSTYVSPQSRFSSMPSSVFGYWMSDQLISTYGPENSLERRAATVKQGTATADDFRFLRLAWEVLPSDIGMAARWIRFAKGGEYSPFYDDVHLLLKWEAQGREVIAWGKGRPQNSQFFGKVGVTWPRRTTSAFSPRPLPAGCAFGDKGPAAFPNGAVDPALVLAVLVSRPSRLLLSVRLGAGDDAPGSASKSYEVGLVGELPFPNFCTERINELTLSSTRCSELAMSDYIWKDETSAFFLTPSFLRRQPQLDSLKACTALAVEERENQFVEISELAGHIDNLVADALEFSEEDRTVLTEELETPLGWIVGERAVDEQLFAQAYLTKLAIPGGALPGGIDAEQDVRVLTRRKRQTASLRSEESICRLFDISPKQFVSLRRKLQLLRQEDVEEVARRLLSYAVGSSFGRFDLRIVGSSSSARTPCPYEMLPACSPGMLRNQEGLPLSRQECFDFQAAGTWHYPVEIAWDGIMVDDPLHPWDIVAQVQGVIEYVWGNRAEDIEQEACEILGVRSLRDYFANPNAFFSDHLDSYRKSRRQAPIYWPVSTESGSYTLWLYYPRMTSQTLHTCVADFVDPKLKSVASEIQALRATNGSRSRLDELLTLEDELKQMRTEIEHVIKLPYSPNHDDGVMVSASPLWKLFRLPKWQKEVKNCWEELERGEYHWARLALSIWPDRVKQKCKTDRSMAIAHKLEHLCEAPRLKAKKGRAKQPSLVSEDAE